MIYPTFAEIQNAHCQLNGIVVETPTLYSPLLSELFDAQIYLKLENFQKTGSFKERGAYTKLKSLPEAALKRGVITVSAGNHAQAVALHAQNLHIPATIVMPIFTPPTKVGHTERWDACVILAGKTLEEAHKVSQELAAQESLTFIHPYDDLQVIAGQGTIGIEMLEAYHDLDIIVVPIGGGGLCAGLVIAAKSMNPRLKICGVEVEGYASMSHVLYGTPESKQTAPTLADGIAVKTPGLLTRAILQEQLDGIIIVTEEEIEHAVDLLACKQNVIVEGAGAAGLSALLHTPSLFKEKKVGIVISGGNIDARIISAIMIRGQIHEGQLVILQIKVNDVPGVLEQVSGIIAHQQANIVEVKHQRLLYEIPIKMAELEIMIETRGVEHVNTIIKELEKAGFIVVVNSSS